MEECVSAHLHIGGAPASHRQNGFMPKCPRRPVHFGAAVRIAITRGDSLGPGAFADVIKAQLIDPDTDTRIFGYGGNDALGGANGNDEIDGGEGDDLIGGGRGSNVLRGGAGNDFISASGYVTAYQRAKPGEVWSAAPAGATVLGSGPTWGVYQPASGEQTWVGVSATPTDVRTGSTIDAGEGNDNALGSWGDHIHRPATFYKWSTHKGPKCQHF